MEKIKINLGIKEKKKVSDIFPMFLGHVLFFVLSFSLGGVTLGDSIAPFALGFLAGAPQSFLLSSAIASALGYFASFKLFDALKNVTAVCIVTFIRLGFSDRIISKKKMLFTALLTFLASFLCSIAVFFAANSEIFYLIKSAGEAVIAAAFSCFILRVVCCVSAGKKEKFFSSADIAAFMFTGSVLILGISRFEIYGFSVGRSLAVFCVLLFSLSKPSLLACVTGACCGVTMGFNETQPQLMLSFVMGGLLSGVCGAFGKAAAAISFLVSATLSLVLIGIPDTALISLAETAAACTIFMLIPERFLLKLLCIFTLSGKKIFEEEKIKLLNLRLKRSAKAVKDVSDSVVAVSKLLVKLEKPSADGIPSSVREDVCAECSKNGFCWQATENITKKSFEKANAAMIKNGRLNETGLPDRLNLICRRKEMLIESFNRFYCERNAYISARSEINDAKIAAASLLGVMSGLLDDTAKEISSFPLGEPETSQAVSDVLREFGISPVLVSAVSLSSGRNVIEAFCSKVPAIPDTDGLLDRLYDVTGTVFLPPVADEYSSEGAVLSFTEEGKYSLIFSKACHTGTGEEFSGDAAECFFDGRGSFYTVLSDGMGTGSRAAIDSVMTCALTSRLMRAGFSPDAALSAVNCALMIKSSEETISTLDILKIELDTGKAEFFKAGAAASVVKKDEKTLVVEKSSMPLGILTKTKLKKSEIILGGGDRVVIMSDGANLVSPQCFKEMFRNPEFSSPEAFAKKVVEKAVSLSVSGRNDDITVVCIKLEKN